MVRTKLSIAPDALLTRRTLLGERWRRALGWRPVAAGAVVSIDVTQGNIQPIPIAIPDFVGGSSNDSDVARNVTQVIAANLKRSGLFAPIDPAAYIERVVEHRRAAAVCRLAHDQRAGARHRPHHPPERRAAEVGIPAVGRGLRRAAHRRAVFHRARHLAPRRAYHLGRDLPAPDRRDRAISTAAWCSSTNPARRNTGSSGSPSWTRTAPTCASSPAAAISC